MGICGHVGTCVICPAPAAQSRRRKRFVKVWGDDLPAAGRNTCLQTPPGAPQRGGRPDARSRGGKRKTKIEIHRASRLDLREDAWWYTAPLKAVKRNEQLGLAWCVKPSLHCAAMAVRCWLCVPACPGELRHWHCAPCAVVPRFANACCEGVLGLHSIACNHACHTGCTCVHLLQCTMITWLILPVVICLSQRLSHACLSTSLSKVKPRMAH